jgi:gluconolactonase
VSTHVHPLAERAPQAIALETLEWLNLGLDHPEGVCSAPSGDLYAGGEAGQVYLIIDGSPAVELVSTGGAILGVAADAANRIYAIDSAAKCVWRVEPHTGECLLWARGPEARPFALPNFGAFGPDGAYYLSDSGAWGASDGCVWRISPGAQAEVWSEDAPHFPNGLVVSPDGRSLYVLESIPASLVEIPIGADGAAGSRRLLCDLDPFVPDGLALCEDGGLYIACYRPDAIYRWHPKAGLTPLVADPFGRTLAAPSNLAFLIDRPDVMVVANLARRHLTRMCIPTRGVLPHFPTRDQLGD